jgi:hypothetical protein
MCVYVHTSIECGCVCVGTFTYCRPSGPYHLHTFKSRNLTSFRAGFVFSLDNLCTSQVGREEDVRQLNLPPIFVGRFGPQTETWIRPEGEEAVALPVRVRFPMTSVYKLPAQIALLPMAFSWFDRCTCLFQLQSNFDCSAQSIVRRWAHRSTTGQNWASDHSRNELFGLVCVFPP